MVLDGTFDKLVATSCVHTRSTFVPPLCLLCALPVGVLACHALPRCGVDPHRALVPESAVLHLPVILRRPVNVELGKALLEPVLGGLAVLRLVVGDAEGHLGVRGHAQPVALRRLRVSGGPPHQISLASLT